jgi:ArsR family transcriptional regulator
MENAEQLATVFRALGDPSRLRLLHALEQGELTVSEITEVTGLSQPRVSRHLKLLIDARVLRRARDRNEIYYRANTDIDRRRLVQDALDGLSPEDPDVARDQSRLSAILDRRTARAAELLASLGIKPVDTTTIDEIRATLDRLLEVGDNAAAKDAAPLGQLLDLGTGMGTMLGLLADRADHVVAIDRSREMRLVARARALAKGLANCTIQDGDMYALSFAPASFDTVSIDRVLGVADRPSAVIAESARVLKPGGRLVVVDTRLSRVDERMLLDWLAAANLEKPVIERCRGGVACIAVAHAAEAIQ